MTQRVLEEVIKRSVMAFESETPDKGITHQQSHGPGSSLE